ncbi:MAG TPA: response regulator [Kofleriaceae bacterium]|nr:response regulator [Kofleriaceae bacterium]
MSDERDRDKGDGRVRGPADDSFNTSEYQALRVLFRDESQEALDQLTHLLLRAPADAMDPAALSELLRTTHSLKGTAGTVGLRAFADAAHQFEGVVERLRGGRLAWSARTRDALVEIIDCLRARAAVGEEHGEEAVALGALLDEKLSALTGVAGGGAAPIDVDPAGVTGPMPIVGEPVSAAYRLARRDERALLRVDPSRIDRLMDGVGELVFDRTRIERRLAELRGVVAELVRVRGALGAAAGTETAGPPADRLRAIERDLDQQLAQLDRLQRELLDDAAALRRTGNALQDGLTDIRMQSSRTLFQRLAPQVRALARAAGKSVRLVTLGGETEFDKSVADQIGDALIHLLRNAVVHGIESAEGRRAAGKPDEGMVTVSARHEGQTVVIEVADDGAGIDPSVLRKRLVDSGRWSAAHAGLADDGEVLRALFDARLSSRQVVDELAGRGIGLDAVRETVAQLGGDLSVASSPGAGTTFSMRLPLTTAITNALLFKVGGHVYAIPNVHVLGTVEATSTGPDGQLPGQLDFQGGAVPLVLLHAVLAAPPPRPGAAVPAVVLDYASRRLALTVDKIVGPREIVVKSLGPLLGPLSLYAGGTISGSGKVQLILDPAALVRLAYPDAATAAHRRSAGRVLIVDDSPAVREAMTRLLERAGYQVDAAPTGLAAWRMLGRARYDALVTDLQMPEMGGVELIERLRADPVLAYLPVVVVSSRASASARTRVRSLGVIEVLAKPVNADALLAALRPG